MPGDKWDQYASSPDQWEQFTSPVPASPSSQPPGFFAQHPILADMFKSSAIPFPGEMALPGSAALLPNALAAARGAGEAAANEIRPLLSKFSFVHPLKSIGDLWDAGANIVQGGRAGMRALEAGRKVGLPNNPIWSGMPEASPQAPDISPIPGSLPSGRIPGGIQNQTPLVQGAQPGASVSISPTSPTGIGGFEPPIRPIQGDSPMPPTSPRPPAMDLINANARAKDAALVQRFVKQNIPTAQVESMPESTLHQHILDAGFRKPPTNPGPASLSRTTDQLRVDIVSALKKLRGE
jgi:hypothetical protein